MAIKAKLLNVFPERQQIEVKYYSDDVPESVVDSRGLKTTLTLTIPTTITDLPALKAHVFANAPRQLLGEYKNLESLRQFVGQEIVE